jgi:hypothetical protein
MPNPFKSQYEYFILNILSIILLIVFGKNMRFYATFIGINLKRTKRTIGGVLHMHHNMFPLDTIHGTGEEQMLIPVRQDA